MKIQLLVLLFTSLAFPNSVQVVATEIHKMESAEVLTMHPVQASTKTVKQQLDGVNEYENTVKVNTEESKKPQPPKFDPATCKLSAEIKSEIRGYQGIVTKIVQETIKGSFKNKAYKDVATFVDKFGSRISGSNALERALNYLKQKLIDQGLRNVHEEPVKIPKWSRVHESAQLLEPWPYQVSSIARYFSIGTPPGGVTTELVVIIDEKELAEKPEKVKGRIVLCDYNCSSNKLKELGALVHIVNFNSIHGFQLFQRYGFLYINNPVPDIPITFINGADKDMFVRMSQRGTKIVMKYELRVTQRSFVISKNIIGEYPGSTKSQEFVGVYGHADTWDISQGIQDGGSGVILALQTVTIFKALNLVPQRTIRTIFWTAEELGFWGSKSYTKKHINELKNVQAQFQADSGCYVPTFLTYAGHPEFGCIVYEIYKLIYANLESSLNSSYLPNSTILAKTFYTLEGDEYKTFGVPGLALTNPGSTYDWIYHTSADTMLKINSVDLDICSAIYSAAVYVLADIDMKMTRILDS